MQRPVEAEDGPLGTTKGGLREVAQLRQDGLCFLFLTNATICYLFLLFFECFSMFLGNASILF